MRQCEDSQEKEYKIHFDFDELEKILLRTNVTKDAESSPA